jgi:hypothetical protein
MTGRHDDFAFTATISRYDNGHGAPIETIRHALTRYSDASACGRPGAILDRRSAEPGGRP